MFTGIVLALIGAAIAVVLAGIGSMKGVGMATEAGQGVLSENPSMFGKLLVLELLPGTQGLYGFIVSFMILINIGILGGNPNIDAVHGMLYLVASLPIGIGGLISGIAQGRAAVAGISLAAKKPSEFSKAMVSTTLVEIYALISFIVSLLTILNISSITIA